MRGVSGYVYRTVPVALHAWLKHPLDYSAAVRAVIRSGGDTDTMAAIAEGTFTVPPAYQFVLPTLGLSTSSGTQG